MRKERVVEYNLEPGEKVLVFIQPLSDKFKAKWSPGYSIVEKVLPDAYIVTNGKKNYRFNKRHVKKDTSIIL